jgi:transcriptional regulator of acetoin/glycerol metabolism
LSGASNRSCSFATSGLSKSNPTQPWPYHSAAEATATQCCSRVEEVSADAAAALYAYRWPLNIRELDQAVAAAAAIVAAGRIDLDDLPEQLVRRAPAVAVDSARREELLHLLRNHHGNLAAIARALATSRAQVHRLLRKFGLDPATFRR